MAAAKNGSGGTILIAVDILPIRHIPNVISLIGDITTEKCKSQIKSHLQTMQADVVLCDGAPNIGASYDRDAYQQNEIALHSLKCATQHLKRGGTFCSKLYRSSDYSAFVWIVKQLFESVQAVKPTASRSQSAEIFLVCSGYLEPTSIDPRLLDPKCVFEQLDGAATGGGDSNQIGTKGITIFHKQFGERTKSRQGYDLNSMDFSMRTIGSIAKFVEGGDPIQMLSQCTALSFEEADTESDIDCQFLLNHKHTTHEIKTCLSDLKVLNKSDFKGLLLWREKMRAALELLKKGKEGEEDVDEANVSSDEEEADSDAEEEGIQAEIQALRQKKLRQAKKIKKKEREAMAKRRRRAALGMDLNAVDVPDNDKIFSLATITSKGGLEAAREVDLNQVTDEQLHIGDVDSDEEMVAGDGTATNEGVMNKKGEIIAQGEEDDLDEDTGYSYRLDRELDAAYDRYLTHTKSKGAKSGTKMAKRSKKAMRLKAADEAKEDADFVDNDTKTYAKMLQGPKDSDDEDSSDTEGNSDDDEDGFRSTPMTPEEHNLMRKSKSKSKEGGVSHLESNPLIHTLKEDSTSVKAARWFSNPLFDSIGATASLAAISGPDGVKTSNPTSIDDYSSSEDEGVVQHLSSDDEEKVASKKSKGKKKSKHINEEDMSEEASSKEPVTADEVLAMMPKTDKQIRHEKRLKSMERMERKKARRARAAGEPEGGFEVVEEDDRAKLALSNNEDKLKGLSEGERNKVMEARNLIKAGLGNSGEVAGEKNGFEVVSAAESQRSGGLLPIMDKRVYNSDNEDYDSDDYAETLALGTMMLRKSKAKSLVDASYNRYSWNDPEGLPDWFQDDENKNYRPQLPIPPALLAKMKEKFQSLATRPIAKVAEARARKSKRAKDKLSAAKKKAETVANSSEMSEAMKLKAISKAMRGHDSSRPGKTYVISKKGGGTRGGKGIKLVDKRLRSDKRSMDRAEKKRKSGKKGGLTGSKKRRHHA